MRRGGLFNVPLNAQWDFAQLYIFMFVMQFGKVSWNIWIWKAPILILKLLKILKQK